MHNITQTIWTIPQPLVNSVADLYLLFDSMPHVNLDGCSSKTLDELKHNVVGKNTYISLFTDANVNLEDKFFFFSTYIYLKEFADKDNVIFLPILNFYSEAVIMATKDYVIDFDSKSTAFNCQMHNQRYNRILASCWLYNHSNLNFNYTQSWDSDEKHALLFELMKLGELATWQGSNYAIKNLVKNYIDSDYRNIELYLNNQQYKNMFCTSAVSIVLGSTFFEYGCDLDEKYLSAVCSGTIPLCDGYLFVDTVKKLGFDTFDDIIDTSYQYEINPVKRTWSMLEKNQHLLTHSLDYINQPSIKERIIQNYQLSRTPKKFLQAAFTKLNTQNAQENFLKTYQDRVKQHAPPWLASTWPTIEL